MLKILLVNHGLYSFSRQRCQTKCRPDILWSWYASKKVSIDNLKLELSKNLCLSVLQWAYITKPARPNPNWTLNIQNNSIKIVGVCEKEE